MIKKYFFTFLIILIFSNIFFIASAFAVDDVWKVPEIEVQFPQQLFKDTVTCDTPDSTGAKLCHVPWIADYISAIYSYAVGVVGIVAVVVMMMGGIIWMTAGGSAGRIGEAKSWITAALTGLVLILASYTILYTVNPDLVNLKFIDIKTVSLPQGTVSTGINCLWTKDTIAVNAGFTTCGASKTLKLESDVSKCGEKTADKVDSASEKWNCCCTPISEGNISGCDKLVYDKSKRNTKSTDSYGLVTCYYDCSSYVEAYLAQQGIGSPGNTTAAMLANPAAVNYTPGMKLDTNDVIVFPGHVVICADATCSQVFNMSGEAGGFKTGQSSSYFLGQAGVKIIKL